MKKWFLPMAMLALPLATFAQTINYHKKTDRHVYTSADTRVVSKYPDSVRIELPDQNIVIVVEAKRFNDAIRAIDALPATGRRLAETIDKAHTPEATCRAHVVRQSSDLNDFLNTTIAENTAYATKVVASQGQLIEVLPPGWEIYVEETGYRVYLYTDQPSQLKNISEKDLALVTEKLQASRNFSGGRKSVKSRFIVGKGALAFSDVKYHQPLDMISLSLSGAVGVLRNTVFPEINGNLGVYIADRFNRNSHRIELSYNTMYFARQDSEGGYLVNYSPFASVSYSKNVGKSDANWYGVGAGFLLKQGGDYEFFKGNTMKIFFTTTIAGGFSFIPEIYLTDDFNRAEFGMKVQYRF